MLIETEEKKDFDRAVRKVEREREEVERSQRRDASLVGEIQRDSRQSKSVERSGKESRIGRFNREYVGKVSELSRLRQTTPNVTSKQRERAEEFISKMI
jgi:hypothetical protein